VNRPDKKKESQSYSSMPINKFGSAAKKSNFRYESMVIVLVVLLGIAYSYYKVSGSLEFSSAKLFEKTFVEPIESIKNLDGGSKAMVGFDSWIRFNSPTGVTLRNAKEFKPYISEAGRSFFAEKYKDDRVLQESVSNYEYLVRTKNEVGSIVNEALLVNKNTHDYFYRIWGL
jgi:hypothetical protein